MTPLNMTAVSWRSNISQGDSMSWNYHKGTSPNAMSPTNSFGKSPQSYQDNLSLLENIEDVEERDHLLEEQDEEGKALKLINKPAATMNLLSSFWSHPVTKTAKDMSSFLKKSQYQLSTQSPGTLPTSYLFIFCKIVKSRWQPVI